jgi:hypothetical protein
VSIVLGNEGGCFCRSAGDGAGLFLSESGTVFKTSVLGFTPESGTTVSARMDTVTMQQKQRAIVAREAILF